MRLARGQGAIAALGTRAASAPSRDGRGRTHDTIDALDTRPSFP
jgi:hypothetical protein